MATNITKTCDVCKKPTDSIEAKLIYVPRDKSAANQFVHSNYTHHLDVGACCSERIKKVFNFRESKRKKKSNG